MELESGDSLALASMLESAGWKVVSRQMVPKMQSILLSKLASCAGEELKFFQGQILALSFLQSTLEKAAEAAPQVAEQGDEVRWSGYTQ